MKSGIHALHGRRFFIARTLHFLAKQETVSSNSRW